MRKKVLILNLCVAILLISCSNNQVQNESQISNLSKNHELENNTEKNISSVIEVKLAVLIGERVIFLNDSLKAIKDSIIDNGSIVKVINSSDGLIYNYRNPCDSYKYIKVEYNNKIGWIDSRNVYIIENSIADTLKTFDNKRCKLYTASNFDTKWFPQEEWEFLNDCNHYYPIVLEIDSIGYFGPIKLVKNHLLEGESWLKNYMFFELVGTSEAYDEILSISKAEDRGTYLMQIKRNLLEASYEIDVILKQENEFWTAEYVRFGKWKAYYPKEQKYYDEHIEKRL